MPIPAAAGFVVAVVHFFKQPLLSWQISLVWLAAVVMLGFLMVSRMRYYSFKALDLGKRRSHIGIVIIALIILAIWLFSEPVLLIFALTYAISGFVLKVTGKIRPAPPAPEEVHAA